VVVVDDDGFGAGYLMAGGGQGITYRLERGFKRADYLFAASSADIFLRRYESGVQLI